MVKYVYDAWGNHKVLDASGQEIIDPSHIGNRNPFRYRSYYYDTETKLYYLKMRYYDPEVGRFISADDLAYVDPDHINGTNLYAYCYNNPVRYIDKLGWNPIDVISEILSLIEAALSGTGQTQIAASNKAFSSLRGVSMYITDSFGGVVLNPSYLACLTRATNLQYNGKVLNVSSKILNGVGYVLLAVDIGLSIYGNATNPNLSTSRKVTDSIIDVGFSIASFVLAAQVGAAFGSMIPIPVVGTLVGAIAGMIVGAAVMLVKEQIGKDLKEGFNKFITKTIPNAWNEFVSGWNKFWSFG